MNLKQQVTTTIKMISQYFKTVMQNHFNEIDYIECDAKNYQTFSKNINFGLRLDMDYLAECSRYFRVLPTHSQSTKCVGFCDDEAKENNYVNSSESDLDALINSSCYYSIYDYELGGSDISHCRKKRRVENETNDFIIPIKKDYCDMV